MVDTGVGSPDDGRAATHQETRTRASGSEVSGIDVSDIDLSGIDVSDIDLPHLNRSVVGSVGLVGLVGLVDPGGSAGSVGSTGSGGLGGSTGGADSECGNLEGPTLAALLDGIDPRSLDSDHEALELVAAWEKLASWVAAQQTVAIAEFARRPEVVQVGSVHVTDPDVVRASRRGAGCVAREFAADELAARLRISVRQASTRLGFACALAAPLRRTRSALASGRIDVARARVIVDGCRGLADVSACSVEQRVLDRARAQTPARLREAVRRAVLAVDPQDAATRTARAHTDRRVVLTPVADGMAELWALLPAADAVRVRCVLTAAARGIDDDRTVDQRMADALVAPFQEALETGELRSDLAGSGSPIRMARHRGVPAHVLVTVPASTLLGLTEDPGELAGYGPITADVAREIAGDATWRRILTDPVSGAVLDVAESSYRPSAALQRLIERRDVRCRFPGCGWPAHATDLDHTKPYPEGPTFAANLGALCRRHHRFKHAGGGGRLRQVRPGVFTWTMPTGHQYTVHPPPVAPPVHSPSVEPPVVAPPVTDDRRPPDLT